MATFVIQVLEPGKKNRKMYAGNGELTTKWIHAMQYRDEVKVGLFIADLADQNPGYEFSVKDITGTGHDMYRNEAA